MASHGIGWECVLCPAFSEKKVLEYGGSECRCVD